MGVVAFTLYAGFIFAGVLTAAWLYTPSRYYMCESIRLVKATRPWLGRLLCLGAIFGAVIIQQFCVALCFEVIFFIVLLLADRQASKISNQHHQLTLAVASGLLSTLKSGYDLMSALSHLSRSRDCNVAELGRLFQALFSQGVRDPTVIRYHRKWRLNASLNQFVTYIFSFLKSGGNCIPWLERSKAFMRKKAEFRKMLWVKTTQIKMQMVILTVFSWLVFAVTLALFPEAIGHVMHSDLSKQFLVMGLAFQICGIVYLQRVLGKMVPENI